MLGISSLLVGCRNTALSHSFLRCECLCGYFMLFLVVPAIEGVKSVINIIGIGYSIIIIMGEHSWCTGSYSFERHWGFDSFPCVLNIIPICFQMFIIISPLTFLH